MRVVRVGQLPEHAIEAAAAFHARVLPEIEARGGDDLVLIFGPAPYDHRGWRLATVQDLARGAAPQRVNGIVGADEDGIVATLAWLERTPGVTGQLFAVGNG